MFRCSGLTYFIMCFTLPSVWYNTPTVTLFSYRPIHSITIQSQVNMMLDAAWQSCHLFSLQINPTLSLSLLPLSVSRPIICVLTMQGEVLTSASAPSPVRMQNLRPRPRPTESESAFYLTGSLGDAYSRWSGEKHCFLLLQQLANLLQDILLDPSDLSF